jgi:hypothetical protein
MIKNHTELLNALAKKYNLKSYLEIGINNKANNYNKIICENKVGVDPAVNDSEIRGMTSDAYFEAIKDNNPAPVFDLIFIDGLHHADQVKRDFENSLRCLSDNGYIVIHDVLPENEAGTIVPRETKQWWGDVYKWAMRIGEYKDIMYETFDIDNGCMLVWKRQGAITINYITHNSTWEEYLQHFTSLMNVTSTVEI